MRQPRALGQQQVQLVADAPVPVARFRARVLEKKRLADKVLEVRVEHSEIEYRFVGQAIDKLQQRYPDHDRLSKIHLEPVNTASFI